MRFLFPLLLVAAGCNPEVTPATFGGDPGERGTGDNPDLAGPSRPAPGSPGTPPGGPADNPDAGATCPPGQHLSGMACVADEVTCAEEFPCPNGQECKGGRCVQTPGPQGCKTNDDCPAGDVCQMGMCQPAGCPNPQCRVDADCGPNQVCSLCQCVPIDHCKQPTPDLSGAPWQAHQVLHLDQSLGGFGKVLVGILKQLRDGILGCPPGSSGNCFLFQIVATFLPDWAQKLIVAVGDFGDLVDNHNFVVDSEMTLSKAGPAGAYTGTDHWQMLSFSYHNMQVMQKPENVPQIGQPVIVPFTAQAVCGILYVDKHKVEGVLSGILKWIVDTAVEVATCGDPNSGVCYHSLGEAIDGAVDCSQVNDLAAQAACIAFKHGLAQKIDDALKQWLLSYSLMTLKGTAAATSAHALDNGHWDGTLGDGIGIFDDFTGEWSARR